MISALLRKEVTLKTTHHQASVELSPGSTRGMMVLEKRVFIDKKPNIHVIEKINEECLKVRITYCILIIRPIDLWN